MEKDERFQELLKEYLTQASSDTWYSFLSSRGIDRPTGAYVIYAKEIEQSKKEKTRRLIQDSIDKASLGTTVESAEINVAKGEIVEQVIDVIAMAKAEKDLYKRVRVLEKAMDILSFKDVKKKEKIKVKLTDMLGEEEKEEIGKIMNIGGRK